MILLQAFDPLVREVPSSWYCFARK